MDKQYLIDFETEVKERYERGEIHAPVHLSSNNEEQLIDIFKNINRDDWVFCSWRNHYHALLHGISRDNLMNQIIRGKSMSIHSKEPKFYSSSIVGGTLPIALGVAKSIKLKGETNKVWCFVGDMTFESGLFHETYKYSRNHDLPLEFVIEDNNLSTNTPTDETWGRKQSIPKDVYYYQYKSDYPHHGTGNWVLF
jgi:pyruvate dehydrogenase E1 component alpha subunit